MKKIKRLHFDYLVLLFAFLSVELLEVWRNFSWYFFARSDFKIWGPIFPIIPFALYAILVLLIKPRLLRAAVVGIGISFVGLLLQIARIYEIGIIITVLYFILGATCGALLYLDRFQFIADRLAQISKQTEGDDRRLAIELSFQECQFYLDKIIWGILTGGAAVGVMMTILWQTAPGIFRISTTEERAARAIEIVVAFALVAIAVGIWAISPLMKHMAECAKLLTPIRTSEQGTESASNVKAADKEP